MLKWKRKKGALRFYHGKFQVKVYKDADDFYFVSHRNFEGHWYRSAHFSSIGEAKSFAEKNINDVLKERGVVSARA